MIDKLAKLLATENIIVEHRNSITASFDTKNRILTLPMWKDTTHTLETLLVGHEVGHALYTPDSGWSQMENRKKIICNVVEDARIERKMKIKYPGLRRDFYEGYKELFDKDFFKIKDKKIETMNFLDRLNMFVKINRKILIDLIKKIKKILMKKIKKILMKKIKKINFLAIRKQL